MLGGMNSAGGPAGAAAAAGGAVAAGVGVGVGGGGLGSPMFSAGPAAAMAACPAPC